MKCFEKEWRMTAHFETECQDSTETFPVSEGFGLDMSISSCLVITIMFLTMPHMNNTCYANIIIK